MATAGRRACARERIVWKALSSTSSAVSTSNSNAVAGAVLGSALAIVVGTLVDHVPGVCISVCEVIGIVICLFAGAS